MINLPEEFENRMKKMLGGEYSEFIDALGENKKIGIRVNALKTDVEPFLKSFPFELKNVGWCKTGFEALDNEKYGRLPLHDAGAFYMQEPSAMAVVSAVESVTDIKGKKVLDLCAAPGGKSTQLAALMQGEGILVSNEINRERAQILSSNIERCGVKNCVVLNETTQKIAENFEEYFDVIVVDAPCSGEGMFRKDDTAISEWSSANVKMCAERQKEILSEAHKTLKPGGILVYSTCTFAPDEDEIQIAEFISEHEEYEILEVPVFKYFDHGHSEWLEKDYPSEIKESIVRCARLWPHKIDGEGHFICVLQKGSNSEQNEIDKESFGNSNDGKRNKKFKKNQNSYKADKKTREIAADFIKQNLENFDYLSEDLLNVSDYIYLQPKGFDVNLDRLKVVRNGIQLGIVKKDRFEPSHSLAMALSKEQVKRSVELDADEALKFRHGEELKKDLENGWTVVLTEGISLGWCKAVNGSLKNHYPKGLRIMY